MKPRRKFRAADLFAGAGGFTTGAEQTGLVDVIWAVNHWPLAFDVHQANHPLVRHERHNVFDADPTWFSGMPDVDVLLASPACQGFSSAATAAKRGGQEMLRATAFTILAAIDGMARRRKKPKLVIVENVRGFKRWSYDPDNPDGSQYRWWLNSIENHGYQVTDVLIDAADVGVPQNRQRLFIVASLGDKPEIPEPSEPHVGFRCCVDLDEGEWRQVDKLDRPAAKKRMIEARKHHPDDDAFLIHHDSYTKGRSLERPIGTITATTHQWGIVKRGARGKDLYRLLSVEEYRRAMAFPEDYVLPRTTTKAVELLGNAVCPPVAQYVIEQAVESI